MVKKIMEAQAQRKEQEAAEKEAKDAAKKQES